MFDEALRRFNDIDSFAAVEYLSQQADPLAALDTCNDLVRHLYNEAKNVPGLVSLGRAGVQYGLSRAAAEPDPARAAEIKGRAKAIAYNVAANTWPGWDDPGIEITRSDLAAGLDAARANLRLARELDRDDLPMSRAHWIIGAHLLAAQRYDEARRAFDDAARLALAAGEPAEALLSKGFAALSVGDDAAVKSIKAELVDQKDGAFFAVQLETARRVFAREY